MDISRAVRRLSLTSLSLGLALLVGVVGSLAQDVDLPGSLAGVAGRGESPLTVGLMRVDGSASEVALVVSIDVAPGAYTYSTSPSFGGGTDIEVAEAKGLRAVEESFTADHAPKVEFDSDFNQELEKYHAPVTWTRRYQLEQGTDPATVKIKGRVRFQVCNEINCAQYRDPFEVALSNEGSVQLASRETAAPAASSPSTDVGAVVEVTPKLPGGRLSPATIRVEMSPPKGRPGDVVTLSVRATLQDGWHTYSLSQPPNNAAIATEIDVTGIAGLEPIDAEFKADKSFEVKHPLPELTQEVFDGVVTWTRQFRVTEAGAQSIGIRGEVRYQTCDHSGCLPLAKAKFELGVVPANAPGLAKATPPETPETVSAPAGDDPTAAGLFPFLIAAFSAGLLALLTPCVFPMIPVTVSFFLKQAEKEHHKPVSTALIYCGGIIVTFTVLGLVMAALFGATSLNELANNPWLNVVIGGVLVFFGLNLLGLFEIRVPSGLLTWSAGHEGQGGVVGVLFMSLTFTLVSFTCTFAFAGLLLAWAANGSYYWPILGMLAFSTAFALPFFFLALFPAFLKKLPKSGGWMNTVKVTMGLVEVGAAIKFFSVADLAWNPSPIVFDYALVMTAWMAIAVCAGMYLLNLFRTTHDTPTDRIGAVRLSFGLLFFGLAGYIAVGTFSSEPPDGKLWKQIAAFAPGRFEGGRDEIGPFVEHEGLRFALDFERAFQVAKERGRPLLLDFTGINCVNCRLMEERMTQPHNRTRLERLMLVQLYTDNVPQVKDRAEAERLLEQNRKFQMDRFGDVTLPSYAVVSPDGKFLATHKGLERKEGDFAAFLDEGLAKWQAQARSAQGSGAVPR